MKEVVWLNHIYTENTDAYGLNDYNLTVYEGEVVCLYGPHASGKSAVRDVLLGTRPIASGEYYFQETLIGAKGLLVKEANVAVVGGKRRFIQNMSTSENMFALTGKMRPFQLFSKKEAREKTAESLKALGLEYLTDKRGFELTAFEENVLLFVRARQNHIKLIIFNYVPFYYGDKELSVLFDLIHAYRKEGISFLIVCEQEIPLMDIADRIQYIEGGKDLYVYTKRGTGLPELGLRYRDNPEGKVIYKKPVIGILGAMGTNNTYLDGFRGFHADLDGIIEDARFGENAHVVYETSAKRLLDDLSVADNACFLIYPKVSQFGVLRRRHMEFVAREFYRVSGVNRQKKKLWELSNVEKKMLAIYQKELLRPQYLILENPFLGLNHEDRKRLQLYLRHLTEAEVTVILLSFSMEELQNSCTKIYVK